MRATYYGMMAEVDAQVGRLLTALDELGATDETVVVVTSDHGEMLGDHGLMSKLGFHDQAFYIPLIVRAPGGTGIETACTGGAGQVVEGFTENIDVMPTVLDLAGAEVPRQCQGRSLRPFLDGSVADGGLPDGWRNAAHWEFDFRAWAGSGELDGLDGHRCNLAVHRDHRGKYVHFAGMAPVFFDLEGDPDECEPLSDHPLMAGYAAALLDWRMATDEQELSDHLALPGGMIVLDS